MTFRTSTLIAVPLLLALIAGITPVCAETVVPEDPSQIKLSFAPVAKAAAPAVVNIFATRLVDDYVTPFANDPFFSQFFGQPGQSSPRVQNALGSGVIVSADGIVVSNYHVVGQANEIRVVLNDRREFDAKVILGDEESDLAILKLGDAADLPTLPFRNSDEVEVGDLVLAIGNPFGVGQTVSSGIVSGLARSASFVGDGLGTFIQTDASINPGNSGGALVDMQGRLVGINTAILQAKGGATGIGFAIPSNLVATVVKQAEAGFARFERPWAGLTGQAVDASLAKGLGLDRPEGVVLNAVHPQSPFAGAGLASGDVITAIGEQPVNTPQDIVYRLAAAGIGSEVAVHYLRDGEALQTEITLIAAPDSPDRQALTVTGDTPLNGLTVARINPAVAQELDLPPEAEGIVVLSAEKLAARAGFQTGDLLLAINGQDITSTADVDSAAHSSSRRWIIDIDRAGQPLRLRFRF